MNCLVSTSTSVGLLLVGLHVWMCNAQYYPNTQVDLPPRTDHQFHTRNFNLRPPHQHNQYHRHYYNLPFDDPPETTVQYYGTTNDNRQGHHSRSPPLNVDLPHTSPSSSLASYRKNPPFPPAVNFNTNWMHVALDHNRGMEITIREPVETFPNSDETEEPTVEKPMDVIPSCEESERISRKDGKCYPLGTTTKVCNNLMRFYMEQNNTVYGDCDCDINNGIVSRPLAYWRPRDSCYLLFHQGPCNYNEWLILDRNNIPVCAPRSCPQSLDENGTSDHFWFLHRGKCYKTGEHYSTFCSEDQPNWKVYFDIGSSEPECLKGTPLVFNRNLLGSLNQLECKPGHKKMLNGECKQTVKFDNNVKDYYDY